MSTSPTTIIATSPAGTGTVDVTVTTAKGTSATSSADQFAYEGAPTVSSISPADGPLSGNVPVTVTGANFTAATQVDFGSVVSASIAITSPTTIVAIAPSAADPATVGVTVTTPSGTSAKSSADHFTYLANPVVTSVSPNQGPVSGGTSVKITGSGFTTATSVTFAGVPATSFTVNSDHGISAVAPAQTNPAPFGATVQVTTPGGTAGNGSPADTFTYTAVVPTVTGVSPNSNTSTGGSLVTITGTGFTSDASVNFGSTPAGGGIGVSVISPTEIQAGSPGGAPGTVDITVTTSGGTSAINAADQFTYLLQTPTITVTPNTGANPGDTVTVTGSGFPTGTGSLIGSGGVVLVEASPLGALVSGFSAIDEIDLNQFIFQPVDNDGNFTTQFTLPSPFMALGDPNAACPPLQNQVDVGLVGCAIAALYESSSGVSLGNVGIANVNSPIIFSGTQPDPPTLNIPSTTVHAGDTINFTGSGWWGSFTGGGATAKICGIAGNPSNCDATTGSGVVAPTTYSGVGGTFRRGHVDGVDSCRQRPRGLHELLPDGHAAQPDANIRKRHGFGGPDHPGAGADRDLGLTEQGFPQRWHPCDDHRHGFHRCDSREFRWGGGELHVRQRHRDFRGRTSSCGRDRGRDGHDPERHQCHLSARRLYLQEEDLTEDPATSVARSVAGRGRRHRVSGRAESHSLRLISPLTAGGKI